MQTISAMSGSDAVFVPASRQNQTSLQLWLGSAMLAGSLVAALFALQGWQGLGLADEGFLWYGVQRTALGEVPIRDFIAYDPGRYYWSGLIAWLSGDSGIVTVRLAAALFQWLGITAAFFLLWREKPRDYLVWCLAGLTLAVWMFPGHKLFDISISILLALALTLLAARPAPQRYVIAGFTVGLAALFGRNHGLYGGLGLGAVIVFLWVSATPRTGVSLLKNFLLSGIGVTLGYAPVLVMLLLIPGFAEAFWQSILFLLEIKATNLPLPVPWPWQVDFSQGSLLDALRRILLGLFFLGLAAFAVMAPILVGLRSWRGQAVSPIQLAAAALAIPYAHFAFSRADASHLAQGLFPALLGVLAALAIARPLTRRLGATALCCASFVLMLPHHPLWQCRAEAACIPTTIGSDTVQVPRGTAEIITALQDLRAESGEPPKPVLVLPFWPGANAVLNQKGPVRATYALFPRNHAFQQSEIARIKAAAPKYAVLLDLPLDGRDDLRFRNTNPLIYRHITQHFIRLPGDPRWPYIELFEAK